MAAKYIVQLRRGTAEEWATTGSSIIPLEGELVVEIDNTNNLHKLKIGDGVHAYKDLAYLKAGDEIINQVITQAIPHIITVTLDVNAWQEVVDITNPNVGCYSQVVNIDGTSESCRLDLQPDISMLAELKRRGIIFTTENKNGVITVYSVGIAPLETYTMQASLVETDLAVGGGSIIGIPVGASSIQPDWNQTDTTQLDYIKNKPLSLPSDGGDADTVNGHTVESDVPIDAIFTDTKYYAAGDALGLVQSGGDVVITNGTITVQDDSHNHTIEKINGLTEALNGKTTEDYVDQKVASMVDSAPETLNTLNELAAALGDDPNFATTVATQIGKKVDKVDGKGLSTNDYTDADKAKVTGIINGEVCNYDDIREQVESHNFGENNIINSENVAGAFGEDNIVGGRAYKILKYKPDSTNNRTTFIVDGDSDIALIPIGTVVTFIVDSTLTRGCKTVNEITYSENNTVVTVDTLWNDINLNLLLEEGAITGPDDNGYYDTNPITWTGVSLSNQLIFPDAKKESDGNFYGTISTGHTAFTAGKDNMSWSIFSGVFGYENSAEGKYSLVSGRLNKGGYASLVGGRENIVSGDMSSGVGLGNTVSGKHSFATGCYNTVTKASAIAVGYDGQADGDFSMVAGIGNKASGKASFAGGYFNGTLNPDGSLTIAQGNEATATGAFAFGFANRATAAYATAIGGNTQANARYSMAEGYNTQTNGEMSLALGENCITKNTWALVGGYTSEASGEASFAFGKHAKALHNSSIALGLRTETGSDYSMAIGKYNARKSDALFEVGNGTSTSARWNAFEVTTDNRIRVDGTIQPKFTYGTAAPSGGKSGDVYFQYE